MIPWLMFVAAGISSEVSRPNTAVDDVRAFVESRLQVSRYKAAAVDLDDDGSPEYLVYADGPQDCGSGGCDLYVLKRHAGTFDVVTDVSIARLPVRVLSGVSHGWHDLGVVVSGGGIRRGYEARLTFDGTTYPDNPTVPPAKPLRNVAGRVVIG